VQNLNIPRDTPEAPPATDSVVPMSRRNALLAGVFFASGFSSLMYQVAWQRLLTTHYGVGDVSTTLIVSIYMFGLGIGALIGGILADRLRDRIACYFVVELLIGCFGLLSLPFLDLLGRISAGSSYIVAGFWMAAFLLVPTLLMGMTLPLLTKIWNAVVRNFLASVSFLYFINTLGAAIGALSASYLVISFIGLDGAIYLAACLNFILAGLIFVARRLPAAAMPDASRATASSAPGLRGRTLGKVAYALVFVTGFVAIGYELIWFRILGVLVKASPYAFSTILFVYLLGIALGSFVMNQALARGAIHDRQRAFFRIQVLIGLSIAAIFIGYYFLTQHTQLGEFTYRSFAIAVQPSFDLPEFALTTRYLLDLFAALSVLLWPLLFVLVPTLLMGASFPLIADLALSRADREGETIGFVYFWNVVGNVGGGIVTGFVLLPLIGTERTLLVFTSIGILFALWLRPKRDYATRLPRWVPATVFVGCALVANLLLFPGPGQLYRLIHTDGDASVEAQVEEGVDGVVVTFQQGAKLKNYIGGMPHGPRPAYKHYDQILEAAALKPDAKNVLIIGFGTGSITEVALSMESVERVTLVELSGSLIRNLRKFPSIKAILDNPRLEVIIDDGRRFLRRTDERFDLILMDPLRTTTAYSNNLYSMQFFELAREHLAPGGVLMSLHSARLGVVARTIASSFPYVRCYRLYSFASETRMSRDETQRRKLLEDFDVASQAHINEQHLGYLGDRDWVLEATRGLPVNQDWRPYAEYYLGLQQATATSHGAQASVK